MKTMFLQLTAVIALFMSAMFNLSAQPTHGRTEQNLEELVADITRNCHSDFEKTVKIADWMAENISLDTKTLQRMIEICSPSESPITGIMNSTRNSLVKSVYNLYHKDTFMDHQFLTALQFQMKGVSISKVLREHEKSLCGIEQSVLEFNEEQLTSGMKVFAERKGICGGIAHLYQLMCQIAGIRCDIVCGVAKGMGGLVSGHAWNAVEIEGEFHLVDLMFQITSTDKSYIDVRPEELIQTHYPIDQKYQLLDSPISIEEFAKFDACGLKDLTPEFIQNVTRLNMSTINFVMNHHIMPEVNQ